ncbi:MAG: DUF1344 domain-containing protein [Hyphomicrobium sp.]|nr:DUF1344 domain-containing protein [Hyphomicrobium sp.]
MRKSILATSFALLTVISSAAFASTLTKSGEIKSVDTAKHELVLSSGETFELAKTIKAEDLKPGAKVTVAYEVKSGKNHASKVEAAK